MPFMRLPNTTRKGWIFLQVLQCQMDQMIQFSRQINQKYCNFLSDFGSLFCWRCDIDFFKFCIYYLQRESARLLPDHNFSIKVLQSIQSYSGSVSRKLMTLLSWTLKITKYSVLLYDCFLMACF